MANAIAHQALAELSKLDNRYKEKREVEHTGGAGMIIGWESPFKHSLVHTAHLTTFVSTDESEPLKNESGQTIFDLRPAALDNLTSSNHNPL